jgi:hypothetical protein
MNLCLRKIPLRATSPRRFKQLEKAPHNAPPPRSSIGGTLDLSLEPLHFLVDLIGLALKYLGRGRLHHEVDQARRVSLLHRFHAPLSARRDSALHPTKTQIPMTLRRLRADHVGCCRCVTVGRRLVIKLN